MHENSPIAPDTHTPVRSSPRDIPLRVIPSTEIFQGDQEILILHGDQTYRLRITRANRLILNK